MSKSDQRTLLEKTYIKGIEVEVYFKVEEQSTYCYSNK